ncbi:peptidoglycan-binding protein [Streptomyces sp. TLI_146]|uniref:peptidoglycan-binding domain-containing protein n=1 Tax=Streptomyces sp. TLI_146 TaxID=1938858 RepID=UPI0015D5B54F|nr:peptidoglycan-binding domain-containing protein [Streptomyces sp. TLI_146]
MEKTVLAVQIVEGAGGGGLVMWDLLLWVVLACGTALLVAVPLTGLDNEARWPLELGGIWVDARPAPIAHQGGYDTGTALVRRGCIGDPVREVQALLLQCGYSVPDVDGFFGLHLESLVEDFQADHGLLADGVVGPATWERLRYC